MRVRMSVGRWNHAQVGFVGSICLGGFKNLGFFFFFFFFWMGRVGLNLG